MAEGKDSTSGSAVEQKQETELESVSDIAIRKKSSGKKDENHYLRQEQIHAYRLKVTKEERAKRSKLRRGEDVAPDSESPKKKKRVSFLSTDPVSEECVASPKNTSPET